MTLKKHFMTTIDILIMSDMQMYRHWISLSISRQSCLFLAYETRVLPKKESGQTVIIFYQYQLIYI